MTRTSDVFTPAKLPTVTDVDRSELSKELRKWVRRGGYFVTVSGTTKLGKTTLVKGLLTSMADNAWSTYISAQSLQDGATDLWLRLARDLGIPTSRETGLASSDKKTWGLMARLKAGLPGASLDTGVSATSSHEDRLTGTNKFDVDPEVAVKDAISLLRADETQVVVAIDDFHFVVDEDARRAIVLALRPLTDQGCSVVLSTIPGGENDVAMSNTNLGGRRKSVKVPRWTDPELVQIANKGFAALSVTADMDIVNRLARESFGSPQIMQQLCLDLCEDVNDVLEGEYGQHLQELDEPSDWSEFFRDLRDDEAVGWLSKLSAGPNPRKARKKRSHPGPPARKLDGYQLIMLALHELGSPARVSMSDVKTKIGLSLNQSGTELNQLALELKAKNLGILAAKDTREALNTAAPQDVAPEDEAEEEEEALAAMIAATSIPQPVFEVRQENQHTILQILDPLLSFTLKWHPEIIEASGRP